MIKNIKWLLLVSLTFVACNSDDDVTTAPDSTDGLPLTSGSADFSKYVALGDSFAAGFSDNALFMEGQKGAYPNIIASRFALVGGGEFTTPFMADNIGGLLLGGTQVSGPRLYFNGVTPAPVAGPPTTEITNHLTGSFNNMGVPGAKSFHLLAPGYGNPAGVAMGTANPYFARFASSTTSTVLEDAIAQNPTFFSLWIGGNDELGYATSGGDPSVNPLTPTATFDGAYNALVSQLVAGGRKGVVANLPYVTTLPYFYVIKYNQLTQANLTVAGANQVNTLNAQLYGPLHNALAFLGQGDRINLLSTTGNNPMLMIDENLPNLATSLTAVLVGGGLDVPTATALGQVFGRARQTLPTDLICLSASARIGQTPSVAVDGVASPSPLLSQLGVTFPLPDRYVLLPSEVDEIKIATDAYNLTIENAATENGLAFVDAKTIMDQLGSASGISANGFNLTSAFVTGGAFSLDGVHPSPRGYALIANKFIEAINAKYGSNLKGVDLGNYRILFPQNPANF
ncbi:SGNH/GDSL hydrolase family protein [Flavobacterium aquatile]|uniref:G-D-S-L family lipolytic protein n=1 Tax=Flavobacterium aquatile LMG 4008 = ATCC 11947 TaxID=1453498 RepID=A0A095U2Y9_9FLAO|nr:SGNH/GDSL hydrolase family protein [Flavobacterium aquatile]KGD68963.1 G-D-S-L family lipolytic protein [Flavobacterium aquatile LMG 4008 = ATCC 11947]OXA65674.1 G-D-S-L family lipolytic protein [Flavobacterium aquatile LMG 4008 = ATCC 11947]GEC79612.1 outer membrane protein [Flavobacterium aquatile]